MDFSEEEEEDEEEDSEGMTTSYDDNTLMSTAETMSAKSFGFVRPYKDSTLNRESIANRIRRHKSFFTQKINENAKTSTLVRKDRTRHGKPRDVMRRAESFHHSRSLIDLELSKDRAYSAERLLESHEQEKKSLSKSKSMEFLKAKLLNRKQPKTPPPKPAHKYFNPNQNASLWGFPPTSTRDYNRENNRRSNNLQDTNQTPILEI